MSEDARNQLRSEVSAIQARLDKEEEEEEERRQFLQQRAELVQRATEAAGPLTDLVQAFLEAMGQHGNPGLQGVSWEEGVQRADGYFDRFSRYKDGWNLAGLWVFPDGTALGGVTLFGEFRRVVALHEAVRDYLSAIPEEKWKSVSYSLITAAGPILHQYEINL
jgi:hypothetical protein